MKAAYYVRAIWDEEAAVLISESDIPGLVIETETLGEFEALVGHLAPEMLAINENIRHASVPVQFTATKRRAMLSRGLFRVREWRWMDHATAAP